MATPQPRPLWLWLCIAAGLVFLTLSLQQEAGLVSPLWWAELGLYALMIAGLARGGFGLTLPAPMLAFVVLSWVFGMVYEVTLTVDGTGYGGVHRDTFASFVLAQGDYIPIALATLVLVRRWHLGFAAAYLVSCGKSLTEGLVFMGVLTDALLSPAWPYTPLMLAYYTLAYASFVALPLLLIAPESLWDSRHPRPKGPLTLIATGFVVAFAIRIVWGLVLAPILTWAFALHP